MRVRRSFKGRLFFPAVKETGPSADSVNDHSGNERRILAGRVRIGTDDDFILRIGVGLHEGMQIQDHVFQRDGTFGRANEHKRLNSLQI